MLQSWKLVRRSTAEHGCAWSQSNTKFVCTAIREFVQSYVTSLKSPEGKQDDFVTKILHVGIGWFLSVIAHNEEVKSKIYRLNDQICVEHSFPQSKDLGITCLCDAVFCSPLFPTMFLFCTYVTCGSFGLNVLYCIWIVAFILMMPSPFDFIFAWSEDRLYLLLLHKAVAGIQLTCSLNELKELFI